MKFNRSVYLKAAAATAVALAALGTATVAEARDNVFWSLGIQAAPGVSIGVGNARPVVVAPAYYAAAPVYVAPAPVYYEPAYYAGPTVYVGVAPVYGGYYYWGPGHVRHWHRGPMIRH